MSLNGWKIGVDIVYFVFSGLAVFEEGTFLFEVEGWVGVVSNESQGLVNDVLFVRFGMVLYILELGAFNWSEIV